MRDLLRKYLKNFSPKLLEECMKIRNFRGETPSELTHNTKEDETDDTEDDDD